MNQTETPSLNNAIAGFVFEQPDAARSEDGHDQALRIPCVDLISKLENLHAKAVEMDRDDFIDEAAAIARRMLSLLSAFNGRFLAGTAAEQTKQEIDRAVTFAEAYNAVLKTRSMGHVLIRAFWKIDENVDVLASHAELGEALVRACATTFYHAVLNIGMDNEFGREIDQSTVVFVNQLQQTWK